MSSTRMGERSTADAGVGEAGLVRLAAGVQLRTLGDGILVRAPGGRAHVHLDADIDATEAVVALAEAGALEGHPAPRLPAVVVTRDGVEVDCAHRLVAGVDSLVGRALFSPLGAAALAILAAAGLVLCAWASLGGESSVQGAGPFGAMAAIIALQLVTTLVHEGGHALVLVHHGRRLGRVGVGFYWGQPCAYVDATDALFLPRRARMIQAGAGVMAELAVAAPLGCVALAFPGSTIAALFGPFAALILISALSNAVPLLELDGYWLLTDALECPDLNQRARRALADTSRGRGGDRRLAAFAPAGVAFGGLLLVSAAFVWWELLGPVVAGLWGAGVAGRVLAVVMIAPGVAALLTPLARLVAGRRG